VKGGSKYYYDNSNAVQIFSTFFGTSSLADIRAEIRASQSPPSKRELQARRERAAASSAVSGPEGPPQYNTSGFMYSTSGRPSSTMKPLLQPKAAPPPPTNSPQSHFYEPIPKPLPASTKSPSKPPSSPAASSTARFHRSQLPTLPAAVPLPARSSRSPSPDRSAQQSSYSC